MKWEQNIILDSSCSFSHFPKLCIFKSHNYKKLISWSIEDLDVPTGTSVK